MNISAIEERRSIRRFKPDAVPEALLMQALEAARLAPSAKNDQPWRFLVPGAQSREKVLNSVNAGIRRRMASADEAQRKGLAGAIHTLRVMKAAPALVLIVRPEGTQPYESIDGTARALELMDAMSVGAAVENMLLEAQALGLGTLWIGNTFFAYEEIVSALGLGGQLLGAVAVGYADEAPAPRPRKTFDEIVEFLP